MFQVERKTHISGFLCEIRRIVFFCVCLAFSWTVYGGRVVYDYVVVAIVLFSLMCVCGGKMGRVPRGVIVQIGTKCDRDIKTRGDSAGRGSANESCVLYVFEITFNNIYFFLLFLNMLYAIVSNVYIFCVCVLCNVLSYIRGERDLQDIFFFCSTMCVVAVVLLRKYIEFEKWVVEWEMMSIIWKNLSSAMKIKVFGSFLTNFVYVWMKLCCKCVSLSQYGRSDVNSKK